MKGLTRRELFLNKKLKLTFKLKGLNFLDGREDPIELY